MAENELVNANNENGTQKENKTDVSALEARIKQLESENGKLKQSVTNASADASEWKKKYQGTLSEQDKAQQEAEAQNTALQEQVKALLAEKEVANDTKELLAIGFDAELSQKVAEAMSAGDKASMFDGIRKFIESHDRELREKAMLNNPTLPGGNADKVITREEFKRMGIRELSAFKTEHPDLYAEYTK